MSDYIARRRAMFSFVKSFPDPALEITEKVTVPDFRPHLRALGLRTAHFLLHAVARASLQVPQFRLREWHGDIVEISSAQLYCSYVVQNPHTDLNHCRVPFNSDLATFAAAARVQEPYAQQARDIILPAPLPPDPASITAILLSIIPWLRVDSIVHGGCSPIPLFTIGKFNTDTADRLVFNISISVHHGLVDAHHVSQFVEQFCRNVTVERNE